MKILKDIGFTRKRMAIFILPIVFVLWSGVGMAGDKIRIPGLSGTSAELHLYSDKCLRGKKIAFVPVALGSALMGTWNYNLEREARILDMKYEVRDPGWNSQAQAQAVAALISEHPDVMIIQNPNVELLARLIKKAQDAGIFVIQINMVSNQKSDAFLGVDLYAMGLLHVQSIAEQFKGKRTPENPVKLCIVQGEQTAAFVVEQLESIYAGLKNHPEIKLVSTQACDWDPNKEHDYMATVLQQHPDLDAVIGMWDVSDMGVAQAIKEAGKEEQIYVSSSGGGTSLACNAVSEGLFDNYINYHCAQQAHGLMLVARLLLQSGLKPGQVQMAFYSPMTRTTKENAAYECTPYPPTKAMEAGLEAAKNYPRISLKYLNK
ncbi:MAG: sugar ABC transporter substrate-binding protein [Deltaproteobacteria bacterium]|nr:sugar ABC transporter substrate-binding protein [Deltaproteobacteria bacterium]